MNLYAMDRKKLLRFEVLDRFLSLIWTERYYGNGDFELYLPVNDTVLNLFANDMGDQGIFLGIDESQTVMMPLKREFDESGNLKVTGISLEQWLNNRFIRASAAHEDLYWPISTLTPGQILSYIVQNMCISGPYMDGTISTGISGGLAPFKVPGLSIGDSDNQGSPIDVAVPYGPIYDALKEIATANKVGMSIKLEHADEAGFSLVFRSYRGLNRTSSQSVNSVIKFTADMNSFTNIKEIQSEEDFKTYVLSFAPSNPGGLATRPGVDFLVSIDPSVFYTGFNLRASLVFADDLTTDMIAGDAAKLNSLLDSRAKQDLMNHDKIQLIDGQVVPVEGFRFGVDYNLGDVVEVQGRTGAVTQARVTEYIRSQDESGEKAYPTLSATD